MNRYRGSARTENRRRGRASGSERRRPRGNWIFGGLWVSWGPNEPNPSTAADFVVLTRVTPDDERSDWKEKPEPTEQDYRAIINGMAAVVADAQALVREVLPNGSEAGWMERLDALVRKGTP